MLLVTGSCTEKSPEETFLVASLRFLIGFDIKRANIRDSIEPNIMLIRAKDTKGRLAGRILPLNQPKCRHIKNKITIIETVHSSDRKTNSVNLTHAERRNRYFLIGLPD